MCLAVKQLCDSTWKSFECCLGLTWEQSFHCCFLLYKEVQWLRFHMFVLLSLHPCSTQDYDHNDVEGKVHNILLTLFLSHTLECVNPTPT